MKETSYCISYVACRLLRRENKSDTIQANNPKHVFNQMAMSFGLNKESRIETPHLVINRFQPESIMLSETPRIDASIQSILSPIRKMDYDIDDYRFMVPPQYEILPEQVEELLDIEYSSCSMMMSDEHYKQISIKDKLILKDMEYNQLREFDLELVGESLKVFVLNDILFMLITPQNIKEAKCARYMTEMVQRFREHAKFPSLSPILTTAILLLERNPLESSQNLKFNLDYESDFAVAFGKIIHNARQKRELNPKEYNSELKGIISKLMVLSQNKKYCSRKSLNVWVEKFMVKFFHQKKNLCLFSRIREVLLLLKAPKRAHTEDAHKDYRPVKHYSGENVKKVETSGKFLRLTYAEIEASPQKESRVASKRSHMFKHVKNIRFFKQKLPVKKFKLNYASIAKIMVSKGFLFRLLSPSKFGFRFWNSKSGKTDFIEKQLIKYMRLAEKVSGAKGRYEHGTGMADYHKYKRMAYKENYINFNPFKKDFFGSLRLIIESYRLVLSGRYYRSSNIRNRKSRGQKTFRIPSELRHHLIPRKRIEKFWMRKVTPYIRKLLIVFNGESTKNNRFILDELLSFMDSHSFDYSNNNKLETMGLVPLIDSFISHVDIASLFYKNRDGAVCLREEFKHIFESNTSFKKFIRRLLNRFANRFLRVGLCTDDLLEHSSQFKCILLYLDKSHPTAVDWDAYQKTIESSLKNLRQQNILSIADESQPLFNILEDLFPSDIRVGEFEFDYILVIYHHLFQNMMEKTLFISKVLRVNREFNVRIETKKRLLEKSLLSNAQKFRQGGVNVKIDMIISNDIIEEAFKLASPPPNSMPLEIKYEDILEVAVNDRLPQFKILYDAKNCLTAQSWHSKIWDLGYLQLKLVKIIQDINSSNKNDLLKENLKQHLENLGGFQSFNNSAIQYLDQINDDTISINSLFRISTLISDATKENILEMLYPISILLAVTGRHQTFNDFYNTVLKPKCGELSHEVRNISQLKLLIPINFKFIHDACREYFVECISRFEPGKDCEETLQGLYNNYEVKCIGRALHRVFQTYPILCKHEQFKSWLEIEIGKREVKSLSFSLYLDIYNNVYNICRRAIEDAVNQPTEHNIRSVFGQFLRTKEDYDQWICGKDLFNSGQYTDPLGTLSDILKEYDLVHIYEPIKKIMDVIAYSNCLKNLTEALRKISNHFGFIDNTIIIALEEMSQKLFLNNQYVEQIQMNLIKNDTLRELCRRTDIVVEISNCTPLIDYIVKNGETFFQGIRAEVDEMYFSDLKNVTQIASNLMSTFTSKSLSSFITNINKKSIRNSYLLAESFKIVGPKKEEIEQIAQKTTQNSKKDLENAESMAKSCSALIYYDRSNNKFQLGVEYPKQNKSMTYNNKEIDQLYKLLKIMDQDDIQGQHINCKEDLQNLEEGSKRNIKELIFFFDKMYDISESLKLLRSLGFIGTQFKEIKATFGDEEKYNQVLRFVSSSKLSSGECLKISREFNSFDYEVLAEDISMTLCESRNKLYSMYQDKDHTFLTYFYSAKLYNLAKYLFEDDSDLSEISDLFTEVIPGIDYEDDLVLIDGPTNKHLDLRNRMGMISEKIKECSKHIHGGTPSIPISKERRISYYFNFKEDDGRGESIPMFKLIQLIFETHEIESPKGSQFIICTESTTEEELIAFCFRSIYSKASKGYFLLHPEQLSRDLFRKLVELYESILKSDEGSRTANVLLVFNKFNAEYIMTIRHSNFFIKYVTRLAPRILNRSTLLMKQKTIIVTSKEAGMGKTSYINRLSDDANHNIVLFFSGELSMEVLLRRIRNLEHSIKQVRKTKTDVNLHIKLDTLDELDNSVTKVDFLLYQLCFMSSVHTTEGCLNLDNVKQIFIEIGNTMGMENLKIAFSSLTLFDKKMMMPEFRLDDIFYSDSVKSKEQIVAFYLNSMRDGKINSITFNDFINANKPFSKTEYIQIIRENFMVHERFLDSSEVVTYSKYNTWIKMCYSLFEQMDISSKGVLYPTNIQSFYPSIRSELVEVIRDFASEVIILSSEQAKRSQNIMIDIRKNYEEKKDQIEQFNLENEENRKWSASNLLIPFVRNGQFFIFGKDKERLKKYPNINVFIKGKLKMLRNDFKDEGKLSSTHYIDLYAEIMNRPDLPELTRKFPNVKINKENEIGVEEGYVMTDENSIKSALLLIKAGIGDPVVLMGESGCGKTYFAKYTCTCIADEEMYVITLHSGVEEIHLLQFIDKCCKRANKMQSSKVWVLFDEFNTSSLQSIISEVMNDRVCSVDHKIGKIPDNLVFVAACNPFQLRSNMTDFGLIPDTAENRLCHKVYIVLDSLLNFVWDFGQLSHEDQRSHIKSIVEAEKAFKKAEYNHILIRSILECHKYIKRIEHVSTISLRDVRRAITILKFLKKYVVKLAIEHKLTKKQDQAIMAIILTLNICYCLRLNGTILKDGTDPKTVLFDYIYEKAIKSKLRLGGAQFKADKIKMRIEDFELALINKINAKKLIPKEIALNKPLRENFFALMVCFATKQPLLICGKPGTSKTLCAQIFATCMKQAHKDSITGLCLLPYSNEIYYGGSQTSTDTGIQKVFDRADNIIESDERSEEENTDNSKKTRPLIIIDEIGLAELSPYRPLKILHPKLEKKDREYAFMGISNWALDLSKMNRMIYVARPDMNFEDLKDTFFSITGLERNQIEVTINYFTQAYLKFREWQSKNGDHRNFHGSRDIYSVFKSIRTIINKQKKEEELRIELLELGYFNNILKELIERNFAGALYVLNIKDQHAFTNSGLLSSSSPTNFVPQGKSLYNMNKQMLLLGKLKTLYKTNDSPLYNEEEREKLVRDDLLYEDSSQTFKKIFLAERKSDLLSQSSLEKFYEERPSLELIKENLNDPEGRFLLLFSESGVVDTLMLELIKKQFPQQDVIDWRRSRIADVEEEEQLLEMLRQLKVYMSKGNIVIFKRNEGLFGSLYDLFNQKYNEILIEEATGNRVEKYCYLYFGDERTRAVVHDNFKCIIIIEEDETMIGAKAEMSQPAPFLNRFEKYRVKLADLLTNAQMRSLEALVEAAMRTGSGRESHLVGLSLEMLISLIMKKEISNKITPEQDHPLQKNLHDHDESLLRLTTMNYLHCQDRENLNKQVLDRFMNAHPYDSYRDLIQNIKKDSQCPKLTIFTFSSSFILQQEIQKVSAPDAWSILRSGDLINSGPIERKKILDDYLQHPLILQIEKRNHMPMLSFIKNTIDSAYSGERFKGVIIFIHLTDPIGKKDLNVDLRDIGLNFWNDWDNIVIENIQNSGYKDLQSLFLASDSEGHMIPIDNIQTLMMNNPQLKKKISRALFFDGISRIAQKCPDLSSNEILEDIFIIISKDSIFFDQLSAALFDHPTIVEMLKDKEFNRNIKIGCLKDESYFNYEDKVLSCMSPKIIIITMQFLLRISINFRFASIIEMEKICMLHEELKNNLAQQLLAVSREILEEEVSEFHKIHQSSYDDDILLGIIEAKRENMSDRKVVLDYWSSVGEKLKKYQQTPLLSLPILYKEISSIISIITMTQKSVIGLEDEERGFSGMIKEGKDIMAYIAIRYQNTDLDDESIKSFFDKEINQARLKYRNLFNSMCDLFRKLYENRFKPVILKIKSMANTRYTDTLLSYLITDITQVFLERNSKNGEKNSFIISPLLGQFINSHLKEQGILEPTQQEKNMIPYLACELKMFNNELIYLNGLLSELEDDYTFEQIDDEIMRSQNVGNRNQEKEVLGSQYFYKGVNLLTNFALVKRFFKLSGSGTSKVSQLKKIIEGIKLPHYIIHEKDVMISLEDNLDIIEIYINAAALDSKIFNTNKIEDIEELEIRPTTLIDLNKILNQSNCARSPNRFRFQRLLDRIIGMIQIISKKVPGTDFEIEFVNLNINLQQFLFHIIERTLNNSELQDLSARFIKRTRAELFGHLRDSTQVEMLSKNSLQIIAHFYARLIMKIYDPEILGDEESHPIENLFKIYDNGLATNSIMYREFHQEIDENLEKNTFYVLERNCQLKTYICVALADLYSIKFEQICSRHQIKNALTREMKDLNTLFQMKFEDFIRMSNNKDTEKDGIATSVKFLRDIAFIKGFLNPLFCRHFNDSVIKTEIENVFTRNFSTLDGNPQDFNNNIENKGYMFVIYFMSNFNRIYSEGLVEGAWINGHQIVQEFINSSTPSKSKEVFVLNKESGMSEIQSLLLSAYEEGKVSKRYLMGATVKNSPIISTLSDGIKMYTIGIVLFNVLMKEADNKEDQKIDIVEDPHNTKQIIKAQVTDAKEGSIGDILYIKEIMKNDSVLRSIVTVEFSYYIVQLADRGYKELNRFNQLANYEAIVRLMLHSGLFFVSFESSSESYYKFNIEKWKTGELNPPLLHCYPAEKRFSNLLAKLLFVQETRIKEGDFTRYYKAIGIFECDCGFVYSLLNCGRAAVVMKCPDCQKNIGGEDHNIVQRYGHVEYKTMDELKARIKLLYLNLDNYSVTGPYNHNCEEYDNYDILEGKQDRTTRILMHLMDHLFMIMLPFICKRRDIRAKYEKYFNNNSTFKEITKMNNIAQNDFIDYFSTHIMYHLEQISSKINIDKKRIVTLANEMIIRVAEAVHSGNSIKSALDSQLVRALFTSPGDNLSYIESKQGEYMKAEISIERIILNIALKRITENDLKFYMLNHYRLAKIMRNLSLDHTIYDQFKLHIKDSEVKEKHMFLFDMINYESLLPVYGPMVMVHINMVNILNLRLGGKYTIEESREITIAEIINEPENSDIYRYYLELKDVWNNVIDKIKDVYTELFNLSFMCQRNLDPEDFFRRIRIAEEATLIDLVLIDSDTNEGIFILGLIQTFIKWQEKILSTARKLLGLKDAEKKNAQDCSISDFVSLPQLQQIVGENSFYDLDYNCENKLLFNLDIVQNKIAKQLIENKPIIVFERNDGSIRYFAFEGKHSKDKEVAEQVIQRMKKIELPKQFEDRFINLHYEDIQAIKHCIWKILVQISITGKYKGDVFVEEFVEKTELDIRGYDHNLFSNIKIGQFKSILTLLSEMEADHQIDQDSQDFRVPIPADISEALATYFEEQQHLHKKKQGGESEGESLDERLSRIVKEIKLQFLQGLQDPERRRFFISTKIGYLITIDDNFQEEFLMEEQGLSITGDMMVSLIDKLRALQNKYS